jgi:hypothetical protein
MALTVTSWSRPHVLNEAKSEMPVAFVQGRSGCWYRLDDAQEGYTGPHGLTHDLWSVRGDRDAGLLCARGPQCLLHSLLCRRLRAWLDLWISPRRLAVWNRRSHLVSRSRATLVVQEKSLAGRISSTRPRQELTWMSASEELTPGDDCPVLAAFSPPSARLDCPPDRAQRSRSSHLRCAAVLPAPNGHQRAASS